MKEKHWFPRLLAGGLVTAALIVVAVAAGQQGSQSDPLITISYLEQQAMPDILEQVDDKVDARESALKSQLQSVVDGYVDQVEDKLSGSGQTAGGAFQTVTLKAGQTLKGSAGCEILLRSGTATCVSGLINTTNGASLGAGNALTANHLYLAVADGQGAKASAAVTLLVRGSYSIQ